MSNIVFRDESLCPDDDRYGNWLAQGSYFGAVGGLSALWFKGWADKVETDAERSIRRWKVLGYLQVAQAVLYHPLWPIEDAVCALKQAVTHYRGWAQATGRVGDARDAHDIARYLYAEGVTKDGKAYLRARLPVEEERRRRLFALKVLRVAQNDVARWIESSSPMTGKPLHLSTAFRVPGLPLDWRTNPYVSDWPKMPYGFTRPLVALDMAAASIVRFPYTFTKRDPTLRDWPQRTDLLDDIVDAIKDAWEWMADRADDVSDWICRHKDVVSGIVVGGTAIASGGTSAAAAAAQYAALRAQMEAGCGAVGLAKAAVALWDWDDRIERIAKDAAGVSTLSATASASARKGAASLEQALLASALVEVRKAAQPVVSASMQVFRGEVLAAVSNPSLRPAVEPLLRRFDGALEDRILDRAVAVARGPLQELVAVRAAVERGGSVQGVQGRIVSDALIVKRVGGAPSSRRDDVRKRVLRGRGTRGGYGGVPEAFLGVPTERSVPVQNAILAGVPLDAINEALYGRGPTDDARGPTLIGVLPALNARTVEALSASAAASPYIRQDETGEIADARAAIRNARVALIRVDMPSFEVEPVLFSGVYRPKRMLGRVSFLPYPPSNSGPPVLQVRPDMGKAALEALAAEDAAVLIEKLRRNNVVSLARLYAERALMLLGRASKRFEEKQRGVDKPVVKKVRRKTVSNVKSSGGGGGGVAVLALAAGGLYWWWR